MIKTYSEIIKEGELALSQTVRTASDVQPGLWPMRRSSRDTGKADGSSCCILE